MNPTCGIYCLQSVQLHFPPFQHLLCFLKIGRVLVSFIVIWVPSKRKNEYQFNKFWFKLDPIYYCFNLQTETYLKHYYAEPLNAIIRLSTVNFYTCDLTLICISLFTNSFYSSPFIFISPSLLPTHQTLFCSIRAPVTIASFSIIIISYPSDTSLKITSINMYSSLESLRVFCAQNRVNQTFYINRLSQKWVHISSVLLFLQTT